MTGPLALLPLDCVNLLFDNVGIESRFYLAHSLKSPSLMAWAKKTAFIAKYGEFTLSEKSAPLDEVIAKARMGETLLPKAVALRCEEDRLVLKFRGEVQKGEISLFEIDQIHRRVKKVLEEINQCTADFSSPSTLKEQKNIKRRRYRFQIIFNHYERLYKETASYYKFPNALAASFRLIDCPPIKIGSYANFVFYGSYLSDRRVEFYVRENSNLKCSCVIKFEVKELKCFLPRVARIEACHFAMLKLIAAIFSQQDRQILTLFHPINYFPLFYETGLERFNAGRERTLRHAKGQLKHLYEVLNLSSLNQENVKNTTLVKQSMDEPMKDKLRLSLEEVIIEKDAVSEDCI